jgi:RNA polymerase-binding transcription factor DksA
MSSEKMKKYNKKEIGLFKKNIIAERDRISKEIGRINESISSSSDESSSGAAYSNHLADQGTDAMEKEKLYSYVSQKDSYLRALNEALERIERGIYGKCEICGGLIPKRRLNVVPSARLCIKCKSDQEKIRKEQ